MRLSLIVTTNLPFESWVGIFGCEQLTGALLDRLRHRVHFGEAAGPSCHLRQSKTAVPKSRIHRAKKTTRQARRNSGPRTPIETE